MEIEPKGRSFAIRQNQYDVLEREYNAAISMIFGAKPVERNVSVPTESSAPLSVYKVQSIKPSGKSSQVLELVDNNGGTVKAYIKAADQSIKEGNILNDVQIEVKNSSYGDYNLISSYKLAA